MEFLTIGETAHLLKVTPTTVRRYIAAGRLPAVRLGKGAKGVRVRKEAVGDFLSPVTPKRSDAATTIREKGGGMKETEQVIPRRLTAEERKRGLAVVENLKRLHRELLAERNGVPFSPSWELINEARDERSCDLS